MINTKEFIKPLRVFLSIFILSCLVISLALSGLIIYALVTSLFFESGSDIPNTINFIGMCFSVVLGVSLLTTFVIYDIPTRLGGWIVGD